MRSSMLALLGLCSTAISQSVPDSNAQVPLAFEFDSQSMVYTAKNYDPGSVASSNIINCCPFGTKFSGGQCILDTGCHCTACAPNYYLDENANCVPDDGGGTACPPGWTVGADGKCQPPTGGDGGGGTTCPPGWTVGADGQCQPPTGGGGGGGTTCPPGWTIGTDGKCQPPTGGGG
ncbi:hypothetical protein BDV33DRAFT_211125, partial [Aspergillus novoparasiticus]